MGRGRLQSGGLAVGPPYERAVFLPCDLLRDRAKSTDPTVRVQYSFAQLSLTLKCLGLSEYEQRPDKPSLLRYSNRYLASVSTG